MYQGFPKMRSPLFDKNVRKADFVHMEVPPRFELGSGAFAELCLTTWLWHQLWSTGLQKFGASDEARTRYLHLGKVALYQMSYTRMLPGRQTCQDFLNWCLRSESNQRHEDFQSSALPTELQRQVATRKGLEPSTSRQVATRKGLEPSTSGVTGRRSNQLNYRAR